MKIAIIGCGQLARMMALAGWRLGFQFSFLASPGESTRCIEGLGRVVTARSGVSAEHVYDALDHPDIVTVEREAVDTQLLRELNRLCPVRPGVDLLWCCQHRLRQKYLLEELGIANTPWQFFDDAASLQQAIDDLGGLPAVAKRSENGYDGRHQRILQDEVDVGRFVEELGVSEDRALWILEQHIDFSREVSLIGVRSLRGEMAFYPPAENHHVRGMLHRSEAPAQGLSDTQLATMQGALSRLMESTDYCGVMAMECFVVGERILVNELAPRVHNSGHWTERGDLCDQFENHLRAITGAPLGNTRLQGHLGMLNIIGGDCIEDLIHVTESHSSVHWYNKQPRPGRKLGHVTVSADSSSQLRQQLDQLSAKLRRESATSPAWLQRAPLLLNHNVPPVPQTGIAP